MGSDGEWSKGMGDDSFLSPMPSKVTPKQKSEFPLEIRVTRIGNKI